MSERDDISQESRDEEAAEPPRIPARHVAQGLLVVWALICVFWFTSERANVPLPTLFFTGNLEALPEGTNFYDLYEHGWGASLLQTYGSLFTPSTWREAEIGWDNIDATGHAEGIGAILLYTLIGVMGLGALGIRWPWPTRLAVGYALGVGTAGWLFEQWGIAMLLNRWTVLATLLVLVGALAWRWRVAAREVKAIEIGEPELGKPFPTTRFDLAFRACVWALFVAFPPTNWDALILYLGNARQTHELGGFPIKVAAQVGVGLGANYPHLYEVTQAAITRLGGHWSPLVGQWAVPWADLCVTVVVFGLAHRAFRRRDLALAAALIFRVPFYAVSWSQLASNYPLAMLITAAILLAAKDWLATGGRRYAALMLLLTAFGCHVNYLMPAMWGIAIAALVFRWRWETCHPVEDLPNGKKQPPRAWRGILALTLIALALGGSWYVRNIVVTGNPVYAFFPEILGGKNINVDVLESAQEEWLANGDGIGRLTSQMGKRSALGNLLALPQYFLFVDVFRLKLAPLFEALTIPGLLMLVGGLGVWRRWPLIESSERALWWVLVLLVFLGLWLYHVAIADYYLYQILPMLVPAALLATIPLTLERPWGGILRVLLVVVALLVTVPLSLMGFKLKDLQRDQLSLHTLTHPFPDEPLFYSRAFGDDVLIWDELEAHWQGATLLTHDNRHLIFDPLVTIVHLDDWEVQPIYQIEGRRGRLDFWRELGVDLYLRIPNEANHRANAWAGVDELVGSGDLRFVRASRDGRTVLYAFPWAEAR
jgi:hypothetical protein